MTATKDITLRQAVRALVEERAYADTLPEGSAVRSAHLAQVGRLYQRLRLLVTAARAPLHPQALSIIRHALDHDPARPRSGGYRNHYDPYDPGGAALVHVEDLVAKGYMQWGRDILGVKMAHVTEEGARAAGCLAAWKRSVKQ